MSATSATLLTDPQQLLSQALQDRDNRHGSRLASMFVGAVRAAAVLTNPDRFAQAAHSMRELLEKLPVSSSGAPIHAPGAKASEQLDEIARHYKQACDNSSCYINNEWTGEIDARLRRLLDQVAKRITSREKQLSKREVGRRFLSELEPLGEPRSQTTENLFVAQWQRHNEFFQGVSHHRLIPSESDFQAHMSSCTDLLVGQLRVPTIANKNLLQQIIAKGEGHG